MVHVPNRYSQVLKCTCWRPVMHAQKWASYSAVYRFCSLSQNTINPVPTFCWHCQLGCPKKFHIWKVQFSPTKKFPYGKLLHHTKFQLRVRIVTLLSADCLTECLQYDIWQTAYEITMHVHINVIVCMIKITVCNTQRTLLSYNVFLYNSLVIKLQSLRCP